MKLFTKKGRENITADSLLRVPGAALLLFAISSASTNLQEQVFASWEKNAKIQGILAIESKK